MGKIKYKEPYQIILWNIEIRQFDECWYWIGALDLKGYGNITTLKWAKYYKVTRAHRLSYLLFKGEFERTLFICHTCHNRRCVNPRHLYAGTSQDNINDMYLANRNNNNVKGSKHGRSKLKEQDVKEIRDLLKFMTGRNIADIYGVNEKTISKIKHKQRWKHVEEFTESTKRGEGGFNSTGA